FYQDFRRQLAIVAVNLRIIEIYGGLKTAWEIHIGIGVDMNSPEVRDLMNNIGVGQKELSIAYGFMKNMLSMAIIFLDQGMVDHAMKYASYAQTISASFAKLSAFIAVAKTGGAKDAVIAILEGKARNELERVQVEALLRGSISEISLNNALIIAIEGLKSAFAAIILAESAGADELDGLMIVIRKGNTQAGVGIEYIENAQKLSQAAEIRYRIRNTSLMIVGDEYKGVEIITRRRELARKFEGFQDFLHKNNIAGWMIEDVVEGMIGRMRILGVMIKAGSDDYGYMSQLNREVSTLGKVMEAADVLMRAYGARDAIKEGREENKEFRAIAEKYGVTSGKLEVLLVFAAGQLARALSYTTYDVLDLSMIAALTSQSAIASGIVEFAGKLAHIFETIPAIAKYESMTEGAAKERIDKAFKEAGLYGKYGKDNLIGVFELAMEFLGTSLALFVDRGINTNFDLVTIAFGAAKAGFGVLETAERLMNLDQQLLEAHGKVSEKAYNEMVDMVVNGLNELGQALVIVRKVDVMFVTVMKAGDTAKVLRLLGRANAQFSTVEAVVRAVEARDQAGKISANEKGQKEMMDALIRGENMLQRAIAMLIDKNYAAAEKYLAIAGAFFAKSDELRDKITAFKVEGENILSYAGYVMTRFNMFVADMTYTAKDLFTTYVAKTFYEHEDSLAYGGYILGVGLFVGLAVILFPP
ncbi:hypothetical protein ACFLQ8_04050, partial [Candidatus Auribacterota bacterium]